MTILDPGVIDETPSTATNTTRPTCADMAPAIRARLVYLENAIQEANNALFDSSPLDVEHVIECHQEDVPALLRSVAAGHAKALGVLQAVIQDGWE